MVPFKVCVREIGLSYVCIPWAGLAFTTCAGNPRRACGFGRSANRLTNFRPASRYVLGKLQYWVPTCFFWHVLLNILW